MTTGDSDRREQAEAAEYLPDAGVRDARAAQRHGGGARVRGRLGHGRAHQSLGAAGRVAVPEY